MGIAGHCNVYGLVPGRARLGATCHPRPRASGGASPSTDSDTPQADRAMARRARKAWEERFDRGPLRVGHTDATSGEEDDLRLWGVPNSRSKYRRTLSRSGGYETGSS